MRDWHGDVETGAAEVEKIVTIKTDSTRQESYFFKEKRTNNGQPITIVRILGHGTQKIRQLEDMDRLQNVERVL